MFVKVIQGEPIAFKAIPNVFCILIDEVNVEVVPSIVIE